MPFGRPRAAAKSAHLAGICRGPVCFGLVQSEFAMAIVAVYQFRAKFRTHSDPMDAPPAVGLSRAGLLLLRQDEDARSDADAIAACRQRGAFDAVIEFYAPLDVAKLQSPDNKDFVPMYEQAMREGHSMSYDPHSAPASEAPAVAQWGFRPDGSR